MTAQTYWVLIEPKKFRVGDRARSQFGENVLIGDVTAVTTFSLTMNVMTDTLNMRVSIDHAADKVKWWVLR